MVGSIARDHGLGGRKEFEIVAGEFEFFFTHLVGGAPGAVDVPPGEGGDVGEFIGADADDRTITGMEVGVGVDGGAAEFVVEAGERGGAEGEGAGVVGEGVEEEVVEGCVGEEQEDLWEERGGVSVGILLEGGRGMGGDCGWCCGEDGLTTYHKEEKEGKMAKMNLLDQVQDCWWREYRPGCAGVGFHCRERRGVLWGVGRDCWQENFRRRRCCAMMGIGRSSLWFYRLVDAVDVRAHQMYFW
jgi:hypothetical protein